MTKPIRLTPKYGCVLVLLALPASLLAASGLAVVIPR